MHGVFGTQAGTQWRAFITQPAALGKLRMYCSAGCCCSVVSRAAMLVFQASRVASDYVFQVRYMCKGCWVTTIGEKWTALESCVCVWICLQDVDPSFPIWASETLEMGGMCRHARLAWPSFLLGRKSMSVSLHSHSQSSYKPRNVTAWWHALENIIRMGGHCCSDESESYAVQNWKPWCVCVCLYRREWSRMLALFQEKKTGFCLGTDSWRRGRAGAGSVAVRNRNRGGKTLSF